MISTVSRNMQCLIASGLTIYFATRRFGPSVVMALRQTPESILKFVISHEGDSERKQFKMEKIQPPPSGSAWPVTTPRLNKCLALGERECEDGSCISRIELCPEEQLMNQNTILIMIVVGLSVVVFLVILYCFQQRQRRPLHNLGVSVTAGLTDEYDNASLYAPPPTYEDVVNTNLYPPTPQARRLRQLSSEEPMTPPPNYDTALQILARSEESVLTKCRRQSSSSVIRRSVSMDTCNTYSNGRTSPLEIEPSGERKSNFFRYSGSPRRHSNSPVSLRQTGSCIPQYSPPPFDLSTASPKQPSGLVANSQSQIDQEAVT